MMGSSWCCSWGLVLYIILLPTDGCCGLSVNTSTGSTSLTSTRETPSQTTEQQQLPQGAGCRSDTSASDGHTQNESLANCTVAPSVFTAAPLTFSVHVQGFIWFTEMVSSPVIMLLGVVGNVLTISIMARKPFSGLTVSVLLTALALSDTATLLMFPFNKQAMRRILGADVRAVSPVGCKFFFWCFRLSKITSSWLLVLITLERFAAVWLPTQARHLATKRHALLAIGGLLGALSVYLGVWAHLTDRIIGGKCIPNTRPPGYEARTQALLIFGLNLLVFIPGLVLLLLNSMIAYRLWQRHKIKVRSSIGGPGGSQPGAGGPKPGPNAPKPGPGSSKTASSDESTKATIMLLGVAVAFLVLMTPIATAHLVFHILDKNIFEVTAPAMVVFREVAQVLELTNSSINFYLYVLCSKGFRRMLHKLLCKPWVHNAVHPHLNPQTDASSVPP